jgi:hypothetical protein
MNTELLRLRIAEAQQSLATGTVRSLNQAARAIREAKGILRCHDTVQYTDQGKCILTLDRKLDALLYCFEHAAYEDAAGHLIDLLFYAAERVVDREDAPQYVREILRHGPTLVEPGNEH